MLGWFKWRRKPQQPTVRHEVIGEVRCGSPTLLLADPAALYAPVRIEGVPIGKHPIHASLIRYPEGGERVAKIAVRFRPGEALDRRSIGSIGVDSAIVVVLDEATFQAHWKEIGPERVGRTGTPNSHRRVAQLIGDKFGLRWREVDFLQSEFREPISEELEARITDFLKTFPEFADYPFMYFRVETSNSLDRVFEAMRKRSWCQLVLDAGSESDLFAVSSGFGDGRYDVQVLYGGGELHAVEVEFIGPAQDKILEAFPVLRH